MKLWQFSEWSATRAMSKEGKHISMDTLARICETLNCEITDVIELVPDEPASTGGKEHERIETKNNGKRN